MIYFLYLIGIWLFINGIYQLIKYFVVTNEISRSLVDSSNFNTIYKNKFIIFLPVLHEEKNIAEFLKELANQNYPVNFYEVYVITTQKEYINNIVPNTIEILKKIQIQNRFPCLNLHLIHYPNINGHKTDQLNFAFQHIRNKITESEISKTFFISFDSDSIISNDTLAIINKTIIDDCEIYQMPLFWTKNTSRLKSKMMQSFSFLQSYFSISYEIPMIIDRFYPWRLKYLLGHGLCIKGSFLLRINGYPNLIEDVRLGRIISYLNVKVILVPVFGVVETAKNYLVYINQSSVWFFGCGLFISDYWLSNKYCNTNHLNPRKIFLVFYGFFKAFRWLNKGLFHLLGISLAFYYVSPLLMLIFSLSLILHTLFPVYFVSKDYVHLWAEGLDNRMKKSIVYNAILCAPFFYMTNFIGLYYGLYKIGKFYLCKQISLPKTER